MSIGQRPSSLSDQVTVLVFKDNFPSRAFRVPLKWVTRIGFLTGFFVMILATSVFVSVRYYRISRQVDTAHVQSLEQEIEELRAKMESQAQSLTQATGMSSIPNQSTPPEGTVGSTGGGATAPATAPQQTGAVVTGTSFSFFAALPANMAQLPERNSLPIVLTNFNNRWIGRSFRVKFAIQYVRTDGGSQQGRIVLVARGSDRLFAYPATVLSAPGNEYLISSKEGEYFSVSRYREVNAEFGPFESSGDLKAVEVFIFNQANQLLIYDRLALERNTAPMNSVPAEGAPKSAASALPQESPTDQQDAAEIEGN